MEIYNLVSKDSDIPQWNESMGKVRKSTNLCSVLLYCYRLYYNKQKDLQWWRTFLRELLDFTKKSAGKDKSEIKKMSKENAKNYQDDDINKIYFYLVLEMVGK